MNTAPALLLRPLAREAAAVLDVVVNCDSTCTLPLPLRMSVMLPADSGTPAYEVSWEMKAARKEAENVGSSNAAMSNAEKEVTEETT